MYFIYIYFKNILRWSNFIYIAISLLSFQPYLPGPRVCVAALGLATVQADRAPPRGVSNNTNKQTQKKPPF